MKQTYRVVASLIALGVLVQAASVAFGWFEVLTEVEDGQIFSDTSNYNAGQIVHSAVGMFLMPVLGLVLLGVSFGAAKAVPGARKWAGIVLGLIVLQVALAFAAYVVPAIGALHGLNALAVLGAAGRASMLTRQPAAGSVAGIPAQRTGSTDASGSTLPV
jgi:heme A synthase